MKTASSSPSPSLPPPPPFPPPSPGGYPVLVYIYGGGFTQAYPESADSFISTSQAFIFVSINYRLGVFGFFALPQLSAEKPGPVSYSGNQGLQDQSLALQWVHDNIAAFGGDPTRVTIQGQSAGSQSVCLHLLMPASRGLFSAAILESHGCDEYGFHLSYGEANTGGVILAKSSCAGSATPLACLRGLSAYDLWMLVNELDPKSSIVAYHYFQPVWDGVIIPQPPKLMLEQGDFQPVPLLLGTNYWEIIVWLYGSAQGFQRYNYTWGNVTENILWYGSNNQSIVDYYRAHYTSVDPAFIESLTAQRFACPTRRIATAYARHGINLWLYLFDYLQVGDTRYWMQHAGHSAELNSVFNHTGSHVVEEDYRMSAEMQNYWLRFLLYRNPSTASLTSDPPYLAIYNASTTRDHTLPHWPVFDLSSESTLYVRNENLSTTASHFTFQRGYYDTVCDLYWSPNVDTTPVIPRLTPCLHNECQVAGTPNRCVDNYDGSYHCQCGSGWAPVNNATDCLLLTSSSSAPAVSTAGPSTAGSPTGPSTLTPPITLPFTSVAPPPYLTSSSSSSSGGADTAGAQCDVWCIVAIVMIVLLSIGFLAALYRLYHSNSRTAPPKPPQAVPAATPRQPRVSRPRPRPPVESVNTSSGYAPVTPVLQANPYEGGLGVPVLQANPYEGSLAPAIGQSHVVDVAPVVSAGGDVWRAQEASPASGVKRKKKVKRAIRIDTGEGGDEALLAAQPKQVRSQARGPVV